MTEVSKGWNIEVQGYKMYCLVKRMKHLKPILNKMNWKNGDLTIKVEKLRALLKENQALVEKNPHNKSIKDKSIEILEEYNVAVKDEEKLLAQKARIDWLNEGDKNSAFFHKVIKGRRSRNRVHSISDENGTLFKGEDVPKQFVKHFQQFLGTASNVLEIYNPSDLFSNSLNPDEANVMIKEVSDKEIKDALFGIGDNKAPGPDGYSSVFFKKAWGIIGKDVCDAVKEFFSSGQMLGELNATLITLVPKIQTPLKVYDFRHIACCNVIYKCISKIITNMIKSDLKKLVQNNQSAFIPGRVIQDNIMISQEILRGYGRKKGQKRCAMKIDLQKAYDTVSWNFLETILIKFGFHKRMVDWIMVCVRTAGFSICINGERHGDRTDFKFHHGCKELQLVNLCFADDLMMFCHSDVSSVSIVKDAIEEFSGVSGLLPNMNKSSLFFGSLNANEKDRIMEVMQFKEGSLPTKYLGVPLITKQLGINDCKGLIDKIKGKTEDWKYKYMSYAGRLMLIAAVLESISVYWASVFKIPKIMIKEINGVLKRYLWSNGDTAKGKAKVSWKQVCMPKEFGGLGIKDLKRWNEALLAKHLWNIASKKDSLWVKDKIAHNFQFKVRNRRNIHMWYDKWNEDGLLIDKVTNRDLYDARILKKISIDNMMINGVWNWPSEWLVMEYLIMKKRLATQDRIMTWSNQKDLICPLCNVIHDSHSHLFFLGEYSKRVWGTVAGKMNLKKTDYIWEDIVQDMIGKKNGNNIWSVVRRISLAAVVYYIWQERNHRIFRGEKSDANGLIDTITETIKLKLMNLRVKESSEVRKVAEMWDIQFKNFKSEGMLDMAGYHMVECQLGDALALSKKCSSLVLDLSENRSFTLVFVMPFSRAPMVGEHRVDADVDITPPEMLMWTCETDAHVDM
ncbi:RNA-directed DNA polymerase, eukaryota, reverse transcriptase zinc-binding domain protein [Tanacetum coccineum]